MVVVPVLFTVTGLVVFAPRSRVVGVEIVWPELAASPAVVKVDRFDELDVLFVLLNGLTSDET